MYLTVLVNSWYYLQLNDMVNSFAYYTVSAYSTLANLQSI